MPDPSKIDAVRSYLQKHFPDYDIKDRSRGPSAHDFRIHRAGATYKLSVKGTFLDGHTPDEIATLLRDWHLERELRVSETASLIVGNGGLSRAWPETPSP